MNWALPAKTSPLISIVSAGLSPLAAAAVPRIRAKGIPASSSGNICQAPSRKSSRQLPSARFAASAVDKNPAPHIAHRAPGDLDPIAGEFAIELPDALGDLAGVKAIASQVFHPIGHEDAMGGAGGGILGNARGWGEVAGHIIDAVTSGCRGYHPVEGKCRNSGEIGFERRHIPPTFKHREVGDAC